MNYPVCSPIPRMMQYKMVVLAIAGLVLLALIIWFYIRGSVTFLKIPVDIFIFLATLVFFGILVDIAEAIGLGFVEDGGELVMYSLITWYVFLLVLHQGKPDVFLVDILSKHFNKQSHIEFSSSHIIASLQKCK